MSRETQALSYGGRVLHHAREIEQHTMRRNAGALKQRLPGCDGAFTKARLESTFEWLAAQARGVRQRRASRQVVVLRSHENPAVTGQIGAIQRPASARVETAGQTIWMQIYSQETGIEVTAIEEKPFQASIKPLEANALKAALDKDGRVALYVNFDFAKATLKRAWNLETHAGRGS